MALGYTIVQQIQELIFGAYLETHHGNPSWVALHNPTRGATQKEDPAATDRKIASCHCVVRLFNVLGMNLTQNNLEASQCSLPRLVYLRFFNRVNFEVEVGRPSFLLRHIFPAQSRVIAIELPEQALWMRRVRRVLNFRGGQPIDGSKELERLPDPFSV